MTNELTARVGIIRRETSLETPPSARRVACVDFDNTLFPWGPLFKLGAPFDGVVNAMQKLREAGYRIVILTSRASETWHRAECAKFGYEDSYEFASVNLLYVKEMLDMYSIPFDIITAEKVPAEVYFDDKAIRVLPFGHEFEFAVERFLRQSA